MKEMTIKAESKVGKLLKHLHNTGKPSIWAGDAAVVMGCERHQVARLCARIVQEDYLTMVWRHDGQHYVRDPRVIIALHAAWVSVSRPTSSMPTELCDEILTVRRSWVKAADLTPPVTTGARSVFDLAGSLR